MKLDHIAITQGSRTEPYSIRAELGDLPTQQWCSQFRMAWKNSPQCQGLCHDIRVDGNSIYLRLREPGKIPDTVNALRGLMADMGTPSTPSPMMGKRSLI